MKKLTLTLIALVICLSATLAQSVGINATGDAPNGSAMLDVSSTTRGFLAPRMTAAQIAAITSPATGLLIYQTDGTAGYYYNSGTTGSPVWTKFIITAADGSETKVTAGTNVTVTGAGTTASPYIINSTAGGSGTHYLGEEYLGGIIFYLYTDNTGTQKGLIVSKTETTTATWSGSSLVGADRTEDGTYNMTLMPTGTGTARTWVETLGAGWYLPSVDELSILWHSRFHVTIQAQAGLLYYQPQLTIGVVPSIMLRAHSASMSPTATQASTIRQVLIVFVPFGLFKLAFTEEFKFKKCIKNKKNKYEKTNSDSNAIFGLHSSV
ncbi:MAG: hypothetical protein WCL06_08200 [Bacteroidota bacterium]